MPRSCSRAMKAAGVVEASCEEVFELVMSMDGTRFDFQYGSLLEEVDGHTAILCHRLQLHWFPMVVWPRDLCYVPYWCCNDDGSYGGGYNISALKSRNGRPRTQVQHLMQIDLKECGVGYLSSFQQHSLLQMLNSIAGLREWFAQSDERNAPPRIPVMVICPLHSNGASPLVVFYLVVRYYTSIHANTTDELPEWLIGAVRVSHTELQSA